MSVIVVTGASSGIGAASGRPRAASARRLAADGHQVIPWDIALAQNPVDVSSTASMEAAAARLPAHIDGALPAAGVSEMAPLMGTTESAWRRQMDNNAFGVFNCLKALVPHMTAGGLIAVSASVAGYKAAPLLSADVASKFAVVGLVKSAAIELGPRGIRVNAVCPGFINTPMQDLEVVWEGHVRGMNPAAVRQEYIRMTPLGRLGEAEDVADLVSHLMTPGSAFTSGAVLTVAGGADV